MKIVHIVSTYPPYKGGMGNVAAMMVDHLKKRGHDVAVITPDYEGDQPSDKDALRPRPWISYGNAGFIPQLYKQLSRFDIIHLHYPFFGGIETVLFYKLLHPKAKLVVSYHMDIIAGGLLGVVNFVYCYKLLPLLMKVANLVICSTQDYAQSSDIASHIDHHRFLALPFGVADDFYPLNTKNNNGSVLNMLFVANLDSSHYFKGLYYLLEAIKLNKNKLILKIIGDGDLRLKFEQKSESLGLSDQIRFLGKLDRADLIKEYQQADVTILPSINRAEAFGLVLIESMSCGTPVIASDLPGVKTVVGNAGLVVPPADAISLSRAIDQLAADSERLRDLRAVALKQVDLYYRWPTIIDRLVAAYKSL